MATKFLSKSRFMSGQQCELKLWYDAYRRNLATPPSAQQQALFDTGNAVGQLAQQRWPGGVEVGFKPWERKPAIDQTQKLMADPSVPAIYEAAFLHDGLYVRVDILARTGEGWDLVEVKSSTRPEKEVFLKDLAVQYWVLSNLGIPLREVGVLVLNNQYVYQGGDYDLESLFRFHDATEYCQENSDWVGTDVQRLHAVLAQSEPPSIEVGDHCFSPYDCSYYGHCSADLEVLEHPITELYRLSQTRRDELRASGIETIPEIPEDFPLTETQTRIRKVVRTASPWRSPELTGLLEGVEWPLYFLDFEAFSPALPRYVGTRPYQAIPFQYSLHVQNKGGGDLEHHEFLHTQPTDPRPCLIDQLLDQIGSQGSIVVYSSYERRVINDLAAAYPQRAEALGRVRDRLWDLLPIVQDHYYHPDFNGSFSIKSVLPALIDAAGWSELEIGDGMSAVIKYEQALQEPDEAIRNRIFDELRDYCRQDTLAMVELREVLLEIRSPHRGGES
jgi:predicted RecB family nuclease